MHETYPWLLHIICICNKKANIARIPTKCWARHYMDIFCLILSNFLSTYLSFRFACIFSNLGMYNIECDSKSMTKYEQRHSEWISCKITSTSNSTCLFNANRQDDSKIKRKQWMAAKLWFRSTSLKTTSVSLEPVTSHSVLRVCIDW